VFAPSPDHDGGELAYFLIRAHESSLLTDHFFPQQFAPNSST